MVYSLTDSLGFVNPVKVLETSCEHRIFLGFIFQSLISLLSFNRPDSFLSDCPESFMDKIKTLQDGSVLQIEYTNRI